MDAKHAFARVVNRAAVTFGRDVFHVAAMNLVERPTRGRSRQARPEVERHAIAQGLEAFSEVAAVVHVGSIGQEVAVEGNFTIARICNVEIAWVAGILHAEKGLAAIIER